MFPLRPTTLRLSLLFCSVHYSTYLPIFPTLAKSYNRFFCVIIVVRLCLFFYPVKRDREGEKDFWRRLHRYRWCIDASSLLGQCRSLVATKAKSVSKSYVALPERTNRWSLSRSTFTVGCGEEDGWRIVSDATQKSLAETREEELSRMSEMSKNTKREDNPASRDRTEDIQMIP